MLDAWCGVTTRMSNRLGALDDTRPPASTIPVNLFVALGWRGWPSLVNGSRCIACLTGRQDSNGSGAALEFPKSVVLMWALGADLVDSKLRALRSR